MPLIFSADCLINACFCVDLIYAISFALRHRRLSYRHALFCHFFTGCLAFLYYLILSDISSFHLRHYLMASFAAFAALIHHLPLIPFP